MGCEGTNGGINGNLIIHLVIENDTDFIIYENQPYNLGYNYDCTYTQLVLGDKVKINTLHGVRELEIPKGTNNGTILTMNNLGIPIVNTNRFGNLYVKLNLKIPKNLSNKQITLLEKLKKLDL